MTEGNVEDEQNFALNENSNENEEGMTRMPQSDEGGMGECDSSEGDLSEGDLSEGDLSEGDLSEGDLSGGDQNEYTIIRDRDTDMWRQDDTQWGNMDAMDMDGEYDEIQEHDSGGAPRGNADSSYSADDVIDGTQSNFDTPQYISLLFGAKEFGGLSFTIENLRGGDYANMESIDHTQLNKEHTAQTYARKKLLFLLTYVLGPVYRDIVHTHFRTVLGERIDKCQAIYVEIGKLMSTIQAFDASDDEQLVNVEIENLIADFGEECGHTMTYNIRNDQGRVETAKVIEILKAQQRTIRLKIIEYKTRIGYVKNVTVKQPAYSVTTEQIVDGVGKAVQYAVHFEIHCRYKMWRVLDMFPKHASAPTTRVPRHANNSDQTDYVVLEKMMYEDIVSVDALATLVREGLHSDVQRRIFDRGVQHHNHALVITGDAFLDCLLPVFVYTGCSEAGLTSVCPTAHPLYTTRQELNAALHLRANTALAAQPADGSAEDGEPGVDEVVEWVDDMWTAMECVFAPDPAPDAHTAALSRLRGLAPLLLSKDLCATYGSVRYKALAAKSLVVMNLEFTNFRLVMQSYLEKRDAIPRGMVHLERIVTNVLGWIARLKRTVATKIVQKNPNAGKSHIENEVALVDAFLRPLEDDIRYFMESTIEQKPSVCSILEAAVRTKVASISKYFAGNNELCKVLIEATRRNAFRWLVAAASEHGFLGHYSYLISKAVQSGVLLLRKNIGCGYTLPTTTWNGVSPETGLMVDMFRRVFERHSVFTYNVQRYVLLHMMMAITSYDYTRGINVIIIVPGNASSGKSYACQINMSLVAPGQYMRVSTTSLLADRIAGSFNGMIEYSDELKLEFRLPSMHNLTPGESNKLESFKETTTEKTITHRSLKLENRDDPKSKRTQEETVTDKSTGMISNTNIPLKVIMGKQPALWSRIGVMYPFFSGYTCSSQYIMDHKNLVAISIGQVGDSTVGCDTEHMRSCEAIASTNSEVGAVMQIAGVYNLCESTGILPPTIMERTAACIKQLEALINSFYYFGAPRGSVFEPGSTARSGPRENEERSMVLPFKIMVRAFVSLRVSLAAKAESEWVAKANITVNTDSTSTDDTEPLATADAFDPNFIEAASDTDIIASIPRPTSSLPYAQAHCIDDSTDSIYDYMLRMSKGAYVTYQDMAWAFSMFSDRWFPRSIADIAGAVRVLLLSNAFPETAYVKTESGVPTGYLRLPRTTLHMIDKFLAENNIKSDAVALPMLINFMEKMTMVAPDGTYHPLAHTVADAKAQEFRIVEASFYIPGILSAHAECVELQSYKFCTDILSTTFACSDSNIIFNSTEFTSTGNTHTVHKVGPGAVVRKIRRRTHLAAAKIKSKPADEVEHGQNHVVQLLHLAGISPDMAALNPLHSDYNCAVPPKPRASPFIFTPLSGNAVPPPYRVPGMRTGPNGTPLFVQTRLNTELYHASLRDPHDPLAALAAASNTVARNVFFTQIVEKGNARLFSALVAYLAALHTEPDGDGETFGGRPSGSHTTLRERISAVWGYDVLGHDGPSMDSDAPYIDEPAYGSLVSLSVHSFATNTPNNHPLAGFGADFHALLGTTGTHFNTPLFLAWLHVYCHAGMQWRARMAISSNDEDPALSNASSVDSDDDSDDSNGSDDGVHDDDSAERCGAIEMQRVARTLLDEFARVERSMVEHTVSEHMKMQVDKPPAHGTSSDAVFAQNLKRGYTEVSEMSHAITGTKRANRTPESLVIRLTPRNSAPASDGNYSDTDHNRELAEYSDDYDDHNDYDDYDDHDEDIGYTPMATE